tara:strand:+ start:919 stop:1557 length:639 start_codon:yes stop_codon:yes gene_type:complete
MEYKSKFEAPKNILDAIPNGESILWKGRPSLWGFSWNLFGLKWITLYLSMLSIVSVARFFASDFYTAFYVDFLPFFLSGIFASIILIGLAATQTYSTVYIITENRVIIKTGAALSFLISMPFKKIKEVNLQKRGASIGTISFELLSEKRVPYISCWPSVRPWKFKRTQPAFSCIGSVDEVATILRKTAMTGNISLYDPRQNLEIGSEIEQKV